MGFIKKLIAFLLIINCTSIAFAEESRPAIYQAMGSIQLSYTAQCHPDPMIVQEYLLVMEIEYLTWLKGKTKDKENLNLVINNLSKKMLELNRLQESCLESERKRVAK